MSTCEGRIHTDKYVVVVKIKQPPRRRCGRACTRFWNCCLNTECGSACCVCLTCILLNLLFVALFWCVGMILTHCHLAPGVELQDLSIRDMAVYLQNASTSDSATSPGVNTDSQWQVKSDVNVTLSMWNRNTLPRCFTACRRMVVYAKYKGHLILRSEIPLGISMKPRRKRPRSRAVSVELKSDHFQVKNELGPALEADLRSDNVTLQFYLDTRYRRSDRRAYWKRLSCLVLAKTPPESSSPLGHLLWKQCA